MNGSGHSRRALDWAIRGASKHQLPLTVMPIHPLRVRPVTGIYRGLRNYPENSYDGPRTQAVQDFFSLNICMQARFMQ